MHTYDTELRRLLCDEHIEQLARSARRVEREARPRHTQPRDRARRARVALKPHRAQGAH